MILVLSGKRSQGFREDVVIGEISGLNYLANDKGQFLLIRSNNNDIFDALLDIDNYLFFIVSKDNCVQINTINEYEWIESKDWYGNKLPGRTIKIKYSVIVDHFISENSYFNKLYKSYYRDLKLNSILEQ